MNTAVRCQRHLFPGGTVLTLATLFVLAVGLSMDAFAVSISNGICFRRYTRPQMLITALFFGGFQGLMPVLGFWAGSAVSSLIQSLDHIIALVLLGYLGGSMIWEALRDLRSPEESCTPGSFTLRQLFLQAVATSIDALAVGISLAALRVDILPAASFISVITFCLTLVGVSIGKKAGRLLKNRAEIFGGAILVLIGLKIFIEHAIGG